MPQTSFAVYPDSDGEPIAENDLQFDWIALLKWNAQALFADRDDVYVAGDHLIYPVFGDPQTRFAPDAYVVFGRPKGKRGSYQVWREADIFPQVIFEVWSPGNTQEELDRKRGFYEAHGAEEFYILYPEFPAFVQGWLAGPGGFAQLAQLHDFASPRLGIRFSVVRGELQVIGPDGREWVTPDEIARQRDEAESQRNEAESQRDEAEARATRMAARLRELGLDPEA